jgi:hypothetical protein
MFGVIPSPAAAGRGTSQALYRYRETSESPRHWTRYAWRKPGLQLRGPSARCASLGMTTGRLSNSDREIKRALVEARGADLFAAHFRPEDAFDHILLETADDRILVE